MDICQQIRIFQADPVVLIEQFFVHVDRDDIRQEHGMAAQILHFHDFAFQVDRALRDQRRRDLVCSLLRQAQFLKLILFTHGDAACIIRLPDQLPGR